MLKELFIEIRIFASKTVELKLYFCYTIYMIHFFVERGQNDTS